MTTSPLRFFDFLETGTCGRVEVIPEQIQTADDIALPLTTLPFGLPSILPTWKKDLEKYVIHPEKLPLHDYRKCQKSWSREKCPENLFEVNITPLQSTIVVERNMTTGKLEGYREELVNNTMATCRNSLSFKRPPGPPSQNVKGSTTNYPFWPGGMDEVTDCDTLLSADKQVNIDFENDLLFSAPGMKTGLNYDADVPVQVPAPDSDEPLLEETDLPQTEALVVAESQPPPASEEKNSNIPDEKTEPTKENDTTTVTPETTSQFLKLSDLLSDDTDLVSDEQFTFLKPQEEKVGQEVNQDAGYKIHKSESLEELVKVKEKKEIPASKTEPVAPTAETKEEWAEMVDVNTPVDDFYKRIPVMAHKWPFELDTFQKQAILHLENHESVFVAAHTSAGKTVIAEYAIASSLRHLTRTIYTSPIKALSNQKFRDFKQTFEDVGLITGDIQLNQTASCLIMTTEILRSMLYNGSDVIRDLEWVIFDEVHYINDAERGVVWEEVLIMLPQTVNIILLSATVPNTLEFAAWIGKIKKRKLYVINTLKRPVPLEHFLYTGNSSKTSNELFLLVDSKGSFQDVGYNKAVAAKKARATKLSENYGSKGPRTAVSAKQDKNIWLSVIEMLRRKEKLPAVAFTFSRKKIDGNAATLTTIDLTSSSEKNEIHIFYQKCISRLKGTDRKLPQVQQMQELLKRGVGIHHSGVLPILKEVVEMLFQKGLLKILFATETFAMGVNMPARTVLFDSISKHDGTNYRNLLPGEYIQMAGRAGRRGLDTTGTVIILCKADVTDKSDLHRMLLGKPTKLESQFRLTYTMILNLLRVEQLRVEDMMKRSFSEFYSQMDMKKHESAMKELRQQLATVENVECFMCAFDLEKYCETVSEYRQVKASVQNVIFMSPASSKVLSTGRVIVIDKENYLNCLGVILQTIINIKSEKLFATLVLSERGKFASKLSDASKSSDKEENEKMMAQVQPILIRALFLPEGAAWHELIYVRPEEISYVTNKTIRVEADKIINDVKKREQPRFREDPPGQSVSVATQELLRLSESNPDGLTKLNIIKECNIRDIDLMEQHRSLQFMETAIAQFNCVNCPHFLEHFYQVHKNQMMKKKYQQLSFLLSDASLTLLPEYQQRVQVLKRFNYIDEVCTVQLKGRVACEISNHEMMITELVLNNVLAELQPSEIASILSCVVFEVKRCSKPKLTPTLKKCQERVLDIAANIATTQKKCGMSTCVEDYQKLFNFGLVEVVYEWSKGMPFCEITELTDVQEGIIVRCIQRLNEVLMDVRNAARMIGDPVLSQKMEEASTSIKRDIVFTASLYTQ